ncbi:MAG: hypothetical protein HYX80_01770 [Chloroflexi bacterium]|nr:hypothetical protein [Chloroflexota bacterium]
MSTYQVFQSSEGDPPFSFQHPSNYLVGSKPLESNGVLVELDKKTLDSPLIQISAEEILKSGAGDTNSVLQSKIFRMSNSPNISDFKILERNVIIVGGIEANYAGYSYIQRTGTGMGKYVVFDHNGLRWTIEVSYSARQSQELEAVFWRLVATFKFLD